MCRKPMIHMDYVCNTSVKLTHVLCTCTSVTCVEIQV